jgi:hypothetical protein
MSVPFVAFVPAAHEASVGVAVAKYYHSRGDKSTCDQHRSFRERSLASSSEVSKV